MRIDQMDDRAGRTARLRVVGLFALSLAASAIALWWHFRPDPARLLARAYTAGRAFEWRLPDAGWARPAVQRSGANRPGSLFEAQAILASGTAAAGKDAAWLALEARADILDLRFE